MKAARKDRVKRELLRDAVTDNLETIRGLPPTRVHPSKKSNVWRRRAPLLLIPLTILLGSSYFMTQSSAKTGRTAALRKTVPHRAATIDSTEAVRAAAFPLAVHRVVIDAGHGGSDPGASGSAEITEKRITLDIAERLRSMLESGGYQVVVTRSDDRLVPLRERARLANSSESDVFISIHVNSIREHRISHGVETYYLGPTKDPLLTRLAAEENVGSGYSMADMRMLLDKVYADVRRDESRRLADDVQQHLYSDLRANDSGLENWGVKRAPFIVLVATQMPAVLAEVGCLSNDREAAMLSRPDYRQQIARALFRGIDAYARKGT